MPLLLNALATQNELRFVLDLVCAPDALNAALTCRAFKLAIFARDWPHQRNQRKITTLRDVVGTVSALQQARSIGCPWDARVCTAAAAAGSLEVLKYARAQNLAIDTAATKEAARHGHFDILKELHAMGCPWHPDTTAAAAFSGDLELLKWVVANDSPWASQTCFAAASSGSVDVLAWAKDHGAPFDRDSSFGGNYDFGSDIFVSVHGGNSMYGIAARKGHIVVLDWLRAQSVPWPTDHGYGGPPSDTSPGLYACAARGGHLPVIEWLEAHGVKHADHEDERACEAAAAGGHLQLLQWLRSRSPPYKWDRDTCKAAAGNGHLDVLRWATEHGAPWKRYWRPYGDTNNPEKWEWCTEMVDEAAKGGHLECLKWIFEMGFPRSLPKDPNPHMPSSLQTSDDLAYMGMYAYDCGQPHVLQWLEENGFPMSIVEERKIRAAPGGDLHRYSSPASLSEVPGGFVGRGSKLVFAKALDSPAEQQPDRLGAVIRGEYVVVVKCHCGPQSFCNCHVSIFWKDVVGGMHCDHEEMFKSSIDHVISDLIPFCGGQYSEYADALGEQPATNLARDIVDVRFSELARIHMLRSEFWSAVRMYLEACAAGTDPIADLPKSIVRFMQQAKDGRVVRLATEGSDAAGTAIDALGGTWPNGQRAPLEW